MPDYLIGKRGTTSIVSSTATTALKPASPGSSLLVPTTNLSDVAVLVNSGRPGQGLTSLARFQGFTQRRARTITEIGWTAPMLIATDADLTTGKYGAVIQGDGSALIQNFNPRSDVPGVPALLIKAGVTRQIRLRGWNILGYGINFTNQTAMVIGEGQNNVIFEECIFFSKRPPAGYDRSFPAKQYAMVNPIYVEELHCESRNAGGGAIYGWTDGGLSLPQRIKITKTLKVNVDSRSVDAAGNWRPATQPQLDFYPAGFLILQGALLLKGMLQQDNRMYQEPEYGAIWEDGESVYSSSIAAGYTGLIERHLHENALVYDPLFTGVEAAHGLMPDGSKRLYSGTLANASDGMEPPGSARTADTIPHGFEIKDGLFITSSNSGLGISTGNRITLRGNTVLSTGAFRSRAPLGYTRIHVAGGASTVGISVYDQGSAYGPGYTNNDPALWFGHQLISNTIGWCNSGADGSLSQFNTYTPGGTAGLTVSGQIILPTPANIPAGLDRNDGYKANFLTAWASAGTIIGCTLPA